MPVTECAFGDGVCHCSFDSFSVFLLKKTKSHENCFPVSIFQYGHMGDIMKKYFIPVNCMGWQVWCGPLGSSSARNICFICFFKARSIGTSRRRSDISTFIQDNNTDIMLLMETWLCPAGDKPRSLIWLCPGTRSSPSPQAARGPAQKAGGIAFIRNSLKPHGTTTLSFPVQHPCFETAQLTLTYNKQLSNFCI